jgi:hypothetical protein
MSLPAGAPALASAHRDAAPTVTVVASGLNGPKKLVFGPGGLYITESGTGGGTCVPGDGGVPFCEGETASVALLDWFGHTHPVLSGLPSVAEGNQGAAGPSSVTFRSGKLAVLYQDALVKADGTSSVQGPGAEAFGKVLRARPFSSPSGWHLGPDLGAFAAAHPQDPATMGGTPGETPYDSNPFDIVPFRGGFAIADAAANSVLWLSPHGHLSMIARLPAVPEQFPAGVTINAQAVPTSLAVGPDGALYVGTLRGVPSLPGTAGVFRVVPGQAPVAAVTGLTTVTDIAFDHHGRLLVLELKTGGLLSPPATPGALLRVDHGQVTTLPVSGLSSPTGLAVGPDGAVYVANNGTAAGTAAPSGEVLKITGLG